MTLNSYTETAGYIIAPNVEQLTKADGHGTRIHTNVYATCSLIATYQNHQHIHFHLDDWLGTRRVQTDYADNVEQNCTSNPFGDGPLCSGASEQFFTGLERDQESGLDHAMFRQYASVTGRWTSPAPYSGSFDFANPQSLNRYAYVGDRPLNDLCYEAHGLTFGQICT